MKKLAVALFLSFALAMCAHASVVLPNVTYIFSDHPGSGLTDLDAGITYGLRVDAFGGSDAARSTFSTTQEGARGAFLGWWHECRDYQWNSLK